MKKGDIHIRQCTHEFAHQTQPAEFTTLGTGESLKEALNHACVSCHTCPHSTPLFTNTPDELYCEKLSSGSYGGAKAVQPDFFCAHHPDLNP